MLVLSRKNGEQIIVGGGITITIVEIRGNQVRIGIDAPADVPIHRSEIAAIIAAEKAQETATPCSPSPAKPVKPYGSDRTASRSAASSRAPSK